MKGFVETPDNIVDLLVNLLFKGMRPTRESVVLDPGCGRGAFVRGIIRWCDHHGSAVPKIVGVESHRGRAEKARELFRNCDSVSIRTQDFLLSESNVSYDFIVGNPPYVPITGLSESEKRAYRSNFATAQGRFDLYILFFERALRQLTPGGRLVFITPEKFLYVDTAAPLRRLLATVSVDEVRLIDEATFGSLITYPTITVAENRRATEPTRVTLRSGERVTITPPPDGSSWQPLINESGDSHTTRTLESACVRISCGVATGADSVFVKRANSLEKKISRFAYPTISGRQLVNNNAGLSSNQSMLIPYRKDGRLMDEDELGPL